MKRYIISLLILCLTGGTAFAKKAEDFPPDIRYRTIIVRREDTLKSIARKYLHDEDRWKELRKINKIFDENQISVGRKLLVPRVEIDDTADEISKTLSDLNKLGYAAVKKELPFRFKYLFEYLDRAQIEFDRGRFNKSLKYSRTAGNILDNIRFHLSIPPVPLELSTSVFGGPADVEYGSPAGDTALSLVRTNGTSRVYISYKNNLAVEVSPNTIFKINNTRSDEKIQKNSAECGLDKGVVDLKLNSPCTEMVLYTKDLYMIIKSPADLEAGVTDTSTRISIHGGDVMIAGIGTFGAGNNLEIKGMNSISRTLQKRIPSPQLEQPPVNALLNGETFVFSWSIPDNKKYVYRFELGNDRYLLNRLLNIHNINDKKISVADLSEGTYFWRASIEKDKYNILSMSEIFNFTIDRTPPVLKIFKPVKSSMVTDKTEIRFEGNCEKNASLTVNGLPVLPNRSRYFIQSFPVYPGLQIYVFVLSDRTGNETHKVYQLLYEDIPVSFMKNKDTLVTRFQSLPVYLPGDSMMKVRLGNTKLNYANNIFNGQVLLQAGVNIIPVSVEMPGKFRLSKDIKILLDQEPPIAKSVSMRTRNETTTILLTAEDDGAGLSKTADISLSTPDGIAVLNGEYDSAEEAYRFIYTPSSASSEIGEVRIDRFMVQDLLGNRIEVTRASHYPGIFE